MLTFLHASSSCLVFTQLDEDSESAAIDDDDGDDDGDGDGGSSGGEKKIQTVTTATVRGLFDCYPKGDCNVSPRAQQQEGKGTKEAKEAKEGKEAREAKEARA